MNRQLFSILTIVVCCFLYGTVYAIYRKQHAKKKTTQKPESTLGDTSYIQEMKHLSGKVGFVLWQQYDILLATQHYGWETMVDWAAYMESADIDSIESLTIGAPGVENIELAHVYNQNIVGLKNFDRLTEEMGSLSIAGHSRTLNDDVKIVWYNQTSVLRVFTHTNDETLITKYVENLIRRTL